MVLMKPESLVLAVAGMCFGVIVGWVLADLNRDLTASPVAAITQPAPAAAAAQGPVTLDEGRIRSLTDLAEKEPDNVDVAVEIGTSYFEAERFEEAVKWYQEALRRDPRSADASARLGLTLFLTQGADPALQQLEHSLSIDPNYPGALFNKGIVLWRGKQDLTGAAEAWKKLVSVAPGSPEAQAAQQGLQAIAGGGPGGAGTPASNQ
jgi:tetratricopeptide (TPR) repeat protein